MKKNTRVVICISSVLFLVLPVASGAYGAQGDEHRLRNSVMPSHKGLLKSSQDAKIVTKYVPPVTPSGTAAAPPVPSALERCPDTQVDEYIKAQNDMTDACDAATKTSSKCGKMLGEVNLLKAKAQQKKCLLPQPASTGH